MDGLGARLDARIRVRTVYGLFRIGTIVAEADAEPSDRLTLLPPEPALSELPPELGLRQSFLARLIAPLPVGIVERGGSGARPGVDHAPVLKEGGEGVLLGPVVFGRNPDPLRFAQAVTSPLESASHRPGENPGGLFAQPLG